MTATREELLSLIGRLEEATGREPFAKQSRNLDGDVHAAIHGMEMCEPGTCRNGWPGNCLESHGGKHCNIGLIGCRVNGAWVDGAPLYSADPKLKGEALACLKARAKLMESAP
ncbi:MULTISPECIES: hypothetical protein [Azospirillum]|uniref:Coil containing protein n=1 Tax=Azospirillum brasilense TaxID=192 RepID=A0ABU4NWV4_AZOBR|nr:MULTISPECIES: hypothetical protein [Azospirillum]YP_001686902.1 hypothetical protein APCd_gp61 [Azospirillum phage Cd]MDW7555351.1 hypothetical protein [Azospirillum brasilense]MDW7595241.1 hypothetical protein [Azospirillum brasilense]MDW7630395.1 hypothetical protein [Azospirillum brasilense]MDX5949762.1 hypothetical protein [Azospirillum brasilense]OPH16889.1 hypothetical protein FE89_02730 [Azospirillum brasilense]